MSKSKQEVEVYSDDEINELAEWFDELTLKQAFFLKETFEAHLRLQAQGAQDGNSHVH